MQEVVDLSYVRPVYLVDGSLSFSGEKLASVEDYRCADRESDAFFDECLNEGDVLLFKEGEYRLDSDIDPMPIDC